MGIVMPPATPAGIIARLNRTLIEVLATKDAKDALTAQGFDTQTSTPEALRARIASDIQRWRTVIAAAGIQAE